MTKNVYTVQPYNHTVSYSRAFKSAVHLMLLPGLLSLLVSDSADTFRGKLDRKLLSFGPDDKQSFKLEP